MSHTTQPTAGGRVPAGVMVALIGAGLALVVVVGGFRLRAQTDREPPGAARSPEGVSASQPGTRPAVGGWPRPRSSERQAERDRMVEQDIARGFFRQPVRDRRVLAAMRAVPRHWFVPESYQRSAYADTPLSIGHGQTISQPYIVALMTEQLRLEPGDKVLEIGTGSGYQAAVLNELTPNVFTIEILRPLYEQAVRRFQRRGYATIKTKLGDGYYGWPEHAPFDAIIVTCAAGHVPSPLWEQLKPGGRMVIPLGGVHEVQRLVVLTKRPDGSQRSRSILPVRFVPMVGKVQEDD